MITVDPDIEGIDEVDFGIGQKEKEKQKEEKNKIVSGNEHELRAKNFAAKRTVVYKKKTESNEDVLLTDGTGSDFKRNVAISSSSANLPKQNSKQPNKFCDEINTAQKDTRQWYEQFGDIFRNLNLFLKQEKSSDLRALLDNNDTNKTLVERLKEALHAKNNTELSKFDVIEKKKILHNTIDDQQQFDDSIQEVHDVSNTFAREIVDDINGIFQHKKNTATALQKLEGRPVITSRMYDMTKLGKTKIYGKAGPAERSEVNEDGIYELLGKKLKSMLTERLRNPPNINSNATNKLSEEIKSNISGEQISRNEASVHYDVANEHKPGSSTLFSANRKKNAAEEATGIPRTFINSTQQTTKTLTKSNNGTGILLELPDGNIILLEESTVDENKTNIKIDIEKAISNMKQNLESASKEIKRLFSHSRR